MQMHTIFFCKNKLKNCCENLYPTYCRRKEVREGECLYIACLKCNQTEKGCGFESQTSQIIFKIYFFKLSFQPSSSFLRLKDVATNIRDL